MEKFNVIFAGKVMNGHSADSLPKILESLKFSNAHIEHLQAGKPLTLKKGLNSKQALQFQHKLAKAGLKTQLSLTLNQACFQLGVKEISKPKAEFSLPYVFNLRWLKPRVIAMPGNYDITGPKGENYGLARQFMPRFSPVSRLILSALITLSLQFYLLRALPQIFGSASGMTTTILGIVFLFSGLLFLPTAMRLISVRRLENENGSCEGSIVDRPSILPTISKHSIYDSGDQHIADISVKKNEVLCYDLAGHLLFEWQAFNKISAEKDTITTVADSVINDTLFGHISDYIENIRQVLQLFSRTPKLQDLAFSLSEASPIEDAYGNIAAAVFTDDLPAIRISPQHQNASFTLKAIAILAMERPLI